MADSGRKLCGKIQATKQWLNRAEENFGKDATARGEMNLLLAEAELRSTRETLHGDTNRLKRAGLKHGIAFAVAVLIAAGGVAGSLLWWRDVPVAVVVSPQVSVPLLVQQPPLQNILAVPVIIPETTPAAAVVPIIPMQEVNNAVKQAAKENPVSADELKRLVRTAGQSLRGQPKQ